MNVSTSTFQTSRRKLKKVDEEENATNLQLGHEFQLKQINHQGETEELIALNLSEARLLIKEALVGRKKALRQAAKTDGVEKLNGNDEDDELLLRSETREKELENLDKLLEQSTTGNNKDLKNSMEYLTNFSRFRDQETVAAVIQLLKSTGLHPFEIAQLGSLACDTADEAKTLIPSLNTKISDDELERILKELSNLETLY